MTRRCVPSFGIGTYGNASILTVEAEEGDDGALVDSQHDDTSVVLFSWRHRAQQLQHDELWLAGGAFGLDIDATNTL